MLATRPAKKPMRFWNHFLTSSIWFHISGYEGHSTVSWISGRLGGSGIPDLYASQRLGLCEWHGVLNWQWPSGMWSGLWCYSFWLFLGNLHLPGGWSPGELELGMVETGWLMQPASGELEFQHFLSQKMCCYNWDALRRYASNLFHQYYVFIYIYICLLSLLF